MLTSSAGDAAADAQHPASRAQVEEKFAGNTAARLGPARAGELLAGFSRLDEVPDCAPLIALTRPRGPAGE